MIELKNVSKIYKSKKSTTTQALKNISIKFPEKGLVFILGKSGSGKSTLLNIIGGLDKYDSGDVIINGKSTKQFKERDFDAFRNTYMGFIFQEYNLLENYSIEQNIKISLEMQYKKATAEEIKKALEQVDLEDISKRKTNELSGGQKQRVAIARALIKNPEIILADEPTGNLDSQTSEQIWEILKKLSETKLVIVVSHDLESAQKYADRTIKIQDGEVISDDVQTEITQSKEFKLQSAKLPFFYNFKMAVGSLLHKKIRLIFSTMLIVFSLLCFGVMLSAYTSDLDNQTIELFEENGPTDVSISKYKTDLNYLELLKEQMNSEINPDELMDKYTPIDIDEELKKEVEKNTNKTWNEVYKIDTLSGYTSMVYPTTLQSEENYPLYYYIGSYAIDVSFLKADSINIENLIGNKPQADDEIVISSYLADCIMYRGCMAKDINNENVEATKYQPNNYQELLNSGKYINFCDIAYLKVVGIINNSETLKEYDKMKQIKAADQWNGNVDEEQSNEIDELYFKLYREISENESKVYVNSLFITKMQNIKNTFANKMTKIEYEKTTAYSSIISYIDNSLEIFTNEGIKTISSVNDNEVVINENILNEITNYDYYMVYEQNMDKFDSKEDFLIQYLSDNGIIGKTIKTNVNNGKLVGNENEKMEYKIIGVTIDKEESIGLNTIYYSQNVIEPLITSNVHLLALNTRVNTVDELKTILKYYPVDNAEVLSSNIYSDAALEGATISYLLQFVAKYGVIFFLVFTAIILMNFINSSIRFRKKEIGTLRALGCRSLDIIKMFLYESIILMIIAFAIAFAIIPNIINSVNGFIQEQLLMRIEILNFGFIQILQITGIILIIVILANIFPVRRITKMKPIDAILNK